MAILVKVNGKNLESENPKYPYLGKHPTNDRVVLFIKENTGVVLVKGKNPDEEDVGYFCDGWLESKFSPLDPFEVVSLQNI